MKFLNSIGRARFILIALILVCIGLAGIGVWHGAALQRTKQPVPRLSEEQSRDAARVRTERGVGTQVRLAVAGQSRREIRAAVDSAADFIYQRSNLNMSEATRERFTQAEQNVLTGRGHRLSVDELADTLAAALAARAATLTDGNIEAAASIYRPNADGQIATRADGRWGFLTRDNFVTQVEAGRAWSRRGDASLKVSLRSLIGPEVSERVASLSDLSPAQFGNAERDGLTPVQALLVAYSVAVEDPLEGSLSDLHEQVVQQRIMNHEVRATREQTRLSDKPYGMYGYLQSSPAYLFFDKAAVTELLSRTEGGKN